MKVPESVADGDYPDILRAALSDCDFVGRAELALSVREGNTGHVCVMCDEAVRTLMAHDIIRKTDRWTAVVIAVQAFFDRVSGDLGGPAPMATPLSQQMTGDGED